MLRNALLAGTALVFTSAAYAQTMVKDIEVTTDLTAIENTKAAAYWANVSDDLEAAIAARLVDRLADDGADIKVDVNELSLSNSFQSALGLEDAVLVGQVNITHDSDNAKFDAYELTISAKAAQAYGENGMVLEGAFTDTPEYYAALVQAFADGVVTRLK
ncbi:hypothetical protein [Pseudotabrizicola sp. L79]|uniref:hypothetical protein n=1 Tax=Pseudotabrizicola sp. L79 TaxID=3118402 RepID=UPI002F941ED7